MIGIDKAAQQVSRNDHQIAPRVDPLSPRWWIENALIVTAGVGLGHNRAAQAIATELGDSRTGESPVILDVLDFMPTVARRVYRDGYLALARRAPTSLGKLYELTDSGSSVDGATLTIDRMLGRRLEAHLERLNPTIVISTHFLATRIAGALKTEGRISGRLIQIVTDFDAHAFWAVREADRICVAAEPARERLINLGIDQKQIYLTGLPLEQAFRNPSAQETARATVGLSPHNPVVLLTLGGFGASPYNALVKGLAAGSHNAQVVVICGRSEAARAEVDAIVKGLPAEQSARFNVIGFTNQMASYMAAADLLIGKPGGITSAEALASGLPMVLVNPIPGQEERNADYLLEQGVAVRCRYPEQLGWKVAAMLGDEESLKRRSEVAKRISRGNGAVAVAQVATGLALESLLDSFAPQRLSRGGFEGNIADTTKIGAMVFDLDHTILTGDIGDAVFEELHQRGMLLNLPIVGAGGETLFEIQPGETPLSRYQRALGVAKQLAEPGAVLAPTYAWMSSSLAGLPIDAVQELTRQVWQRGGIELRPAVLDVLAKGLGAGHRGVVVSATNQAIVSVIVDEVVNRRLKELGISRLIDPNDVWGMNNGIVDGIGVRNALLDGGPSDGLLAENILVPHSSFAGKAELLRGAGYERIVSVAGDSPNDFEMMKLADQVIWISRADSPGNTAAFCSELRARPEMRFLQLQ